LSLLCKRRFQTRIERSAFGKLNARQKHISTTNLSNGTYSSIHRSVSESVTANQSKSPDIQEAHSFSAHELEFHSE